MISIADVAPTSLERSATHLLRLSMVVIFFWFGLQKFTAYEAEGIATLVSNSPLTSWLNVLGTQGASMVVGTSELTFGVLLAIGLRWPGSLAATLGALGSCVTFLTTLSFMVTTPGVWAPSGPPLLSGTTGVFLIKDIVLLATSILLLAQALTYRRAIVTPAVGSLAGPFRLPDHNKGTEDVAAYHKQPRPL
jgi:uncharacterized membrane protein YkgB